MALPKQKFREAVFQMLYSLEAGNCGQEALISLIMKELSITKKSAVKALQKAEEVRKKFPQIDSLISENCHSYHFQRIQSVEKTILRLALFELLQEKDIPPKVAIAEALRLTKKFSTPESVSFVNAILDAILKKDEKDQN